MPNVGAVVDTPSGPGKVVEANVLKGQVRVQLQDDGSIIEMPVKTCCDGGNEVDEIVKKIEDALEQFYMAITQLKKAQICAWKLSAWKKKISGCGNSCQERQPVRFHLKSLEMTN